jgi:hypothetical protein
MREHDHFTRSLALDRGKPHDAGFSRAGGHFGPAPGQVTLLNSISAATSWVAGGASSKGNGREPILADALTTPHERPVVRIQTGLIVPVPIRVLHRFKRIELVAWIRERSVTAYGAQVAPVYGRPND